ncbi:hypothetical protein C1645_743491 [Glomus cerebriforme]|uniref:AIG1-type G domain-containing protein n=1 Tax=Glomus cerebriforme TaxID=658196 RepID=A0A397S931_9GLOM|nr:hypothetical protein C1645_743491 [Glomus cerebriforme]
MNFQKSEIFQWNGKSYRIVDNIGFGDNNFTSEADILHRIGEGIYSTKEGINQVLFVFGGRFSEEQVIAFNMFKKFISESRITEFTTLVRTNFPNFRNQKKCEDDRETLLAQNKELREIIESCKGIVYVDNPAIPVIEDEDSEDEIEDKNQEIVRNEKKRKESRKILLNYLVENCQNIYKLKE